MKTLIRLQAVLLTVLLITAVASAQVARYSAEYMAEGGGARARAMGSAYAAQHNDAWSLLWNPAGLARLTTREAGLMHSERFEGVVDYDAAVYAMPSPDGSVLSAGFVRLGVNGIPFTQIENEGKANQRVIVDKYVNEGEYAFYAAAANWIGRMRWGVAPKLIFKHIGSDYKAYGLGIDAGIGGQIFENFPLEGGLVARDVITSPLAWDKTGHVEFIVPTIRAGLASKIDLPMLEAVFSPVAEVSYRLENAGYDDAIGTHFGGEYLVRNVFALRGGINEGNLTAGGGLNLKTFSVDYAFVEHDDLGDTHRISINARWSKN